MRKRKMKKFFDFLYSVLPHAIIIMSLFLITCFIVDRFNRTMSFVNNDITKYVLLFLSVSAIIQSVVIVVRKNGNDK